MDLGTMVHITLAALISNFELPLSLGFAYAWTFHLKASHVTVPPFSLLCYSDEHTILFPLCKFFFFNCSSFCLIAVACICWWTGRSCHSTLVVCNPFSFLRANNFSLPLVLFSCHCCGDHWLVDWDVLSSFSPPLMLLGTCGPSSTVSIFWG